MLEKKRVIRLRDSMKNLIGSKKKKMPLIDIRQQCLIESNGGRINIDIIYMNRLT